MRMPLERITVFLPCHSLHDFPTWLDEQEADALLAAWTAAWHPWLIAATAATPRWASVDLPPADVATLGIVPAPWDDRFATQLDAVCGSGSRWVRGVTGQAAIVTAAATALADGGPPQDPLPGDPFAADFHALGLATLLAELLAQRMRSAAGLDATDFNAAAVRAARAAVAGEPAAARGALQECHGILEATRAHYYPVDVWLLDLVLLADSTLGPGLDRELNAAVPLGLMATGQLIEQVASRNPAALARIRERAAAGTLAPIGGRYDATWFDACTPEEVAGSFARGRAVWRELVGVAPITYGQQAGGSTPLLPDLLAGLGFTGMIWTLFDGTPLPDPAASRIRWEGRGGATIDGVARPPLDARSAQMILSLPERLGDAMDHDHTAVIQFAHHAGTASPWFDALRRIGAAGSALGTFITPPDLFSRTAGAGTVVSFDPDAFPVGLPAADAAIGPPANDPVAARLTTARAEARRLTAAADAVVAALPAPVAVSGPTARPRDPRQAARGGLAGWFATGRPAAEPLVLEHDRLRVEVHRLTGGLLSVRRPADRSNRLSQRLALRTTRPAPAPGQPWEDATERAVYSGMEAEAIERLAAADGHGEAICSRGRLVDGRQRAVGSFTQRVELVPGMPLAVIDVAVTLVEPPRGPLFEHHAACRFAWNENEDLDVRRSLLSQSVATERGRFTAPWFIELGTADADRVSILTGGLPWHARTSTHMLDSILPLQPQATAGERPICRLGVGIGIERPWDLALALAADRPTAVWPAAIQAGVPANVRLTVDEVRQEGGRIVAARVGLLESAGRSGEVRLEWAADVAKACVCNADGVPLPPAASAPDRFAIAGRGITLFLARYQWLHLDVEFRA